MKYIYLGVCDYLLDVKHDKAIRKVEEFYVDIKVRDSFDGNFVRPHKWKEGSVWHYIRQRKKAKQWATRGIK